LPEKPDSEGLGYGGLDSEHVFSLDARAIIPLINSGEEEFQILTKATTRVVFVTSPPSPGRNRIVLLALYPPRQADENKPYNNATSRNLSKCGLESGWYEWVDLLPYSPDGLSGDMNLKRFEEWSKTLSALIQYPKTQL